MAESTEIPFAVRFLCSAFATCFAETSAAKRVSSLNGGGSPRYKGLLSTVTTIAREEGLFSLWKGIVPGLHRQCLYGGLRIGMYEPVRDYISGDYYFGSLLLLSKIMAGLITGAIAILVANPTDLVKVRLQADGMSSLGLQRRYSGAFDAYHTIVKQEGLLGLWTGVGPNIARNSIINAAELASYDHIKEIILNTFGFTDGVLAHALAGLGAGFFAVFIGSPVDVGFLAFYKGFFPNFIRLGLWNLIMFLTFEQLKRYLW